MGKERKEEEILIGNWRLVRIMKFLPLSFSLSPSYKNFVFLHQFVLHVSCFTFTILFFLYFVCLSLTPNDAENTKVLLFFVFSLFLFKMSPQLGRFGANDDEQNFWFFCALGLIWFSVELCFNQFRSVTFWERKLSGCFWIFLLFLVSYFVWRFSVFVWILVWCVCPRFFHSFLWKKWMRM